MSAFRTARVQRSGSRSWGQRLLVAIAVPLLVMPVVVAVFVGARCYAPAPVTYARPLDPPGLPGYTRPEADTFLTLPEWYIVYSTDEYARFIQHASPSDFPYVSTVAQYWRTYGAACDATRGRYPFEIGYHMMLGIIGMSFTVENAVKTVYENTLGLLAGWLFTTDTAEDWFAAVVARDYGAFMHHTPWYRFPFFDRLGALWSEVPTAGPHPGRKWERRFALTAEYAVKGAYGWVLGLGSPSTYGAEALVTHARVTQTPPKALAEVKGLLLRKTPTGDLVTLPRYEAFTPAAVGLIDRGGHFADIAGNHEVVIGALAPATFDPRVLTEWRLVDRQLFVSRPDEARLALSVPVSRLPDAIRQLRRQALSVEHLYDY